MIKLFEIEVLRTVDKPFWQRVSTKTSREAAMLAKEDAEKVYPTRKYRVRKIRAADR